jgi:delta(3,5)-delta(2,4)-dienoyl-CoA isomerase
MTMYTTIRHLQDLISSMEKCRKPVIGAIHNACVGAGVDMITAMDVRLCTADAWFCVKEVDMGLAADVGTLQRLPKVIGSQSLVNDLCLTARRMDAAEAERCGLVSTVFPSKEDLMVGALAMAANIASKSPVAVQGTKDNLVYSREHSVQEGLERIATYNMTMLQSEDLMKAAIAAMDKESKELPEFAKL